MHHSHVANDANGIDVAGTRLDRPDGGATPRVE